MRPVVSWSGELGVGWRRRNAQIRCGAAAPLADRSNDLRGAGLAPRLHVLRGHMNAWIELAQDLRYGARLLARNPGFALVAVCTLALAIGATASLFSVVRGVLLRPLPYSDPDRLVYVWEVSPRGDSRNVVSPGNYHDWRERATVFEAIGATTGIIDRAVTGGDEPIKIESVALTPSTLDVLGVRPLLGRVFAEADGAPNAPALALLAHGFWQRRFGGDPSAIGRVLQVDGGPVTIVGVMPATFRFPSPEVDLLTNLRFDADDRAERRSHNYVVLGRLKPGVDIGVADAAMDAIALELAREHPQHMTGWSVNVVSAHADAVREVRPLLLVLTGVVIVVLLIACANLAGLQLARATRRAQELAVRAAIGAGRGRIVRQLLAESFLVALLGGVGGVALAALSLEVIVANAPADIPFIERVRIDPAVLGVAVLVTMASAVLVGLAPALRAARAELRPLLQSARVRVDRSQQRLRQALVVCQIALALVLLVAAALLVRSFWQLNQVEYGYDPNGVLTVSIDLPRVRYPDQAAQLRFYEQLFDRLRARPGVAAAAGTTGTPGVGAAMTFSFAIEGRPSSNPSGREDPVPLQGVTRGYFETMRIPVVGGRVFDETDRPGSRPVIVINEALARRHWPDGAVGARINFRPGEMPWYEIVGVVGDTRDEGVAEDAPPMIYAPFAQRAPSWAWMSWQTLLVRAADRGDPLRLVPDVRAAIWSIDRNLPLLDVATVEARLAENEARRRMALGLLGAFALVAVLLGTLGVYGVMSYSVSEQRQEIGIRVALGARPAAVAAGVVRRGAQLAGTGVLLGLGTAALVTRTLETLLYEITPTDPQTFASMAVLLLAVATLAAWIPARRAMCVDPAIVLRDN